MEFKASLRRSYVGWFKVSRGLGGLRKAIEHCTKRWLEGVESEGGEYAWWDIGGGGHRDRGSDLLSWTLSSLRIESSYAGPRNKSDLKWVYNRSQEETGGDII